MKALTFSKFGGPEVLEYREVPDPVPAPGEALVRLHAIGLNFADIYRRQGNYHLTGLPPYIAGYEGAGTVIDANDCAGVSVGARVCFADVALANAELVLVPLDRLIPLPDAISFEMAASVILQGLTAHYLTTDSYAIRPGDTALVHASAGGVGQLLVQMIRNRDAQVIALTSSPEKAAQVEALGASLVLLTGEDWVEPTRRFTGGRGVDVAYDSVGITLSQSLAATREGGTLVFFGFAGGNPPLVDPRQLMDGSKAIRGGDLWSYLKTREDRLTRSAVLFDWIQAAKVRPARPTLFPLAQGAEAHAQLESRKTTGKILLIP